MNPQASDPKCPAVMVPAKAACQVEPSFCNVIAIAELHPKRWILKGGPGTFCHPLKESIWDQTACGSCSLHQQTWLLKRECLGLAWRGWLPTSWITFFGSAVASVALHCRLRTVLKLTGQHDVCNPCLIARDISYWMYPFGPVLKGIQLPPSEILRGDRAIS